jgi:hypothetical protein
LCLGARYEDDTAVDGSSIELAALDVDAVLAHSHAEVLHGEDSPALAATLSTTAVTRALDAEVVVLRFGAGVLASLSPAWCCCALGASCSQSAHGVVAGGVGRPYAGELVGVGRDVGDELLGRKREEAGKVRRGLGWRGQTGACEVVVGNRVGNLSPLSAHASPNTT